MSLSGWTRKVGREFGSLVDDSAHEAVLRILDNLDSFRGESKFTTWAMMAVAVKDVPIEEVARRTNTNRNALYKLMHDARMKLNSAMESL